MIKKKKTKFQILYLGENNSFELDRQDINVTSS